LLENGYLAVSSNNRGYKAASAQTFKGQFFYAKLNQWSADCVSTLTSELTWELIFDAFIQQKVNHG